MPFSSGRSTIDLATEGVRERRGERRTEREGGNEREREGECECVRRSRYDYGWLDRTSRCRLEGWTRGKEGRSGIGGKTHTSFHLHPHTLCTVNQDFPRWGVRRNGRGRKDSSQTGEGVGGPTSTTLTPKSTFSHPPSPRGVIRS